MQGNFTDAKHSVMPNKKSLKGLNKGEDSHVRVQTWVCNGWAGEGMGCELLALRVERWRLHQKGENTSVSSTTTKNTCVLRQN